MCDAQIWWMSNCNISYNYVILFEFFVEFVTITKLRKLTCELTVSELLLEIKCESVLWFLIDKQNWKNTCTIYASITWCPIWKYYENYSDLKFKIITTMSHKQTKTRTASSSTTRWRGNNINLVDRLKSAVSPNKYCKTWN